MLCKGGLTEHHELKNRTTVGSSVKAFADQSRNFTERDGKVVTAVQCWTPIEAIISMHTAYIHNMEVWMMRRTSNFRGRDIVRA